MIRYDMIGYSQMCIIFDCKVEWKNDFLPDSLDF